METRNQHVRRALFILPAVAALTLGGTALSLGGSAQSASAATATGGTKTVVWAVPGGLGDRFAEPQTLAPDASGCGDFQVDTYRYDSTSSIAFVDALVDRGTLAKAGDDGPVFISNRDVSNTCDASGRVISTTSSDGVGAASASSGGSSSGSSGGSSGSAASVSGSGDPTGVLAFTGSGPVAPLAAGGLLAVAAGLVVFGIRRFVVEGR